MDAIALSRPSPQSRSREFGIELPRSLGTG
jgi:hypothetical protein